MMKLMKKRNIQKKIIIILIKIRIAIIEGIIKNIINKKIILKKEVKISKKRKKKIIKRKKKRRKRNL